MEPFGRDVVVEDHHFVLDALDDESWRVREMALKVITRHGLDDPEQRIVKLLEDPSERVRLQARRALGIPRRDR